MYIQKKIVIPVFASVKIIQLVSNYHQFVYTMYTTELYKILGFLESVMRGIFCVSEGVECRIWNPTSVLKEPEQTLQNCSDGHVKLTTCMLKCSYVRKNLFIGNDSRNQKN